MACSQDEDFLPPQCVRGRSLWISAVEMSLLAWINSMVLLKVFISEMGLYDFGSL